jgi:hypothetical protein
VATLTNDNSEKEDTIPSQDYQKRPLNGKNPNVSALSIAAKSPYGDSEDWAYKMRTKQKNRLKERYSNIDQSPSKRTMKQYTNQGLEFQPSANAFFTQVENILVTKLSNPPPLTIIEGLQIGVGERKAKRRSELTTTVSTYGSDTLSNSLIVVRLSEFKSQCEDLDDESDEIPSFRLQSNISRSHHCNKKKGHTSPSFGSIVSIDGNSSTQPFT